MNVWLDFAWQLLLGYSPNKRAEKKARKMDSSLPLMLQSTSTPQTPLHQAVLRNDLDQVRVLLRGQHLIDPIGPQGNTPLIEAVKHQYLFIVRALLSSGANPHLTNIKGESAYSLAQQSTHAGIRQALGLSP